MTSTAPGVLFFSVLQEGSADTTTTTDGGVALARRPAAEFLVLIPPPQAVSAVSASSLCTLTDCAPSRCTGEADEAGEAGAVLARPTTRARLCSMPPAPPAQQKLRASLLG